MRVAFMAAIATIINLHETQISSGQRSGYDDKERFYWALGD